MSNHRGRERAIHDAIGEVDPSTFRACADDSSDAIMLTDTEGTIRYVNPAWERIYGYHREEAIGETPRLLRSGRHGKEFYAALWRDLLDPAQATWKGEVINRAKDGREVTVHLTITPFRDRAGVVRGYMSLASDLTERKRLETQLRRQDRLATIGLLASGLAHEIGTPLGVARGRAEYLLQEMSEGSAEHRSLSAIVSQIDRVSKIIHALLRVARTEGTDTVVPVTLRTALESVTQLLGPKLSKNGIELAIEFGNEIRVMAEPNRLRQVFLNLCLNAVQAIEAARAAGRTGGHRLALSVEDAGEFWDIAVKDTGCGISQEASLRLFTPFFTTKEVGEGTGLGLVTAQQYVSAWGGALWADGASSNGACFRIRLVKPACRR